MHRIVIIYPERNTSTIPSLVALLRAMVGAGYAVDLFCKQGNEGEFSESGVRVLPLIERFRPGTIWWKLWFIANWMSRVVRHCFLYQCHMVLAVDPWGLFLAYPGSWLRGVPFGYFSLEILARDEQHSISLRLLKRLESFFNRGAEFTIIQDSERGAVLGLENRLPAEHKMIYLPNSYPGGGISQKTDFLQKTLSIPLENKIVLYAGSVHPELFHCEVAATVGIWPPSTCLVVHAGRPVCLKNSYGDRLRGMADGGRVYLTAQELSESDYEKMVSSAHIGVALYTSKTQNLIHLGLSSGKVAKYLQCGLPIIVSSQPSLLNLVSQYECGVAVAGPSEIPGAVAQILAEYARYSSNARRCFHNLLRLDEGLANIVASISESLQKV